MTVQPRGSSRGLLTVGHSTHELDTFIGILQDNLVTAVADVRSTPASRFTPQFNQTSIKTALRKAGIDYVFLGAELGARSKDPTCYADGRVQYDRLARTLKFASGIQRLLAGSNSEQIAIMCAEQEPLDCHRTVLIARVLVAKGAQVEHILHGGLVESHSATMDRLMSKFGLEDADLFRTREERLEEALIRQEQRIAYVDQELAAGGVSSG